MAKSVEGEECPGLNTRDFEVHVYIRFPTLLLVDREVKKLHHLQHTL